MADEHPGTADTGAVSEGDTAPLSAAAGAETAKRQNLVPDGSPAAGVRKTTRRALFEELYAETAPYFQV